MLRNIQNSMNDVGKQKARPDPMFLRCLSVKGAVSINFFSDKLTNSAICLFF